MADPNAAGSKIAAAEQAAKNAASGFLVKQEGWVKSHAIPLIIGAFAGGLAVWFFTHILTP